MLITTPMFELSQGYHFIGSVLHGSSAGGNTIDMHTEDTGDLGGQQQFYQPRVILNARCFSVHCRLLVQRVMGHDQGHAGHRDILLQPS